MDKILPEISDLTRPFYEGCLQNELRLQFCIDCKRYQYYPRIVCCQCGGQEIKWSQVSGRAALSSYTVVRRSLTQAYEAPYTLVLASLLEGPTMMSQLVGEFENLSIGDSLVVEFVDWGNGIKLPLFKRDPA